MRFSLFDRHPREELSGYLDNELIPLRVEAVKAHLASCPTCRAELDALRNLKSQLAALPEVEAPRSFALTPQMAQRAAPEPARVRAPARVAALSNGMRLAGAGMAVALAVVMVLNFSGSGSDNASHESAASVVTANSNPQFANAFTPEAKIVNGLDTGAAYDDSAESLPAPAASSAAGGVAGGPNAGSSGAGGTTSGSEPGATPHAEDANGLYVPPATPRSPLIGDVVPSAAPADTALPKSENDGSQARTSSESPEALALPAHAGQTAQPAANPASATSDSGGVDILFLVAIALAAGVVLAFAGSVLIPRVARDEDN